MLFYILFLMVIPLVTYACSVEIMRYRHNKWLMLIPALLWMASFHTAIHLMRFYNNDSDPAPMAFLVTIVVHVIVQTAALKTAKTLAAKDDAEDDMDSATANGFMQQDDDPEPVEEDIVEPENPSGIKEITDHSDVINGIQYLGHVSSTLDEMMFSAGDIVFHPENTDNVAYSNGEYVYMYMNKQWFYAHISVFLKKPNMYNNPVARAEGREVRHFKCFDTSLMGPEFSQYVAYLADRPEKPCSNDLYEHLRDNFAAQLQLSEAIDIFNERIKTLTVELSRETNSEVIRQFKSISELPNTNVRAAVIRAEAEKRSEQMRKDNNTSEPFNDFPLTSRVE